MGYYESFYPGKNYGGGLFGNPLGYTERVSGFNLALDPRTANQLQETSNKLNTGIKNIEIQGTFAKVLEAIPDEHLREINKLSKITGTKLSFHGPLVEPSGFNQQAGRWEEFNRLGVERQLSSAVERAHQLDPKGNIVVTLHSSSELPEMLQREKVDGKEKQTGMYIVDPRTGKVNMIKETERYFPESASEKKEAFDPAKELNRINNEQWTDTLRQFAYYADIAENRGGRERLPEPVKVIQHEIDAGKLKFEDAVKDSPALAQYLISPGSEGDETRNIYLRNSYNDLKTLFDIAYKNALEHNNKIDLEKLNHFKKEVHELYPRLENNDSGALSVVIQDGLHILKKMDSKPQIFQPFNDFVIDKSSTTFANVALNSYKKFGKDDSAPIISIENPPAGSGLSRAEDLKKLIDQSRKKFEDGLVKEGYSREAAEKASEKTIGATWDVGHINMIRKFGFDKKDLIKEAETISPYLKHVHLSDNFGFEHTELPMGMGNVPLKEEFAKFGEKIKNVQKVIEVGDWWQHFKTAPLVETFAAFSSPIYSDNGPSWNQAAMRYGNYFGGFGTMLPEQHFSMYGGGFSTLPTELGGQIQRKGSGLSGTPME
ncbi:MAG: hypothetical protein AABX03_02675 [Nanoarchaeota archaeon]